MHELVAGKAPFDSPTVPDLFVRILTEAPRPLSEVRPGVPAALERVVLRCLEKDAAKRFANVAELASALAECGSGAARVSADRISRVLQGHLATPLAQPSAPAPAAAVPVALQRERTTAGAVVVAPPGAAPGARRNVPAIVASAVALVAVVALIGVLAYGAGSRSAASAAAGIGSSPPAVSSAMAASGVAPLPSSGAAALPPPPPPAPSAAPSASKRAAGAGADPGSKTGGRDDDHPSHVHQLFNGLGRDIKRTIQQATQ